MHLKFDKTYLAFYIIVFELVALNSPLYRERILVIGSQSVDKTCQDLSQC